MAGLLTWDRWEDRSGAPAVLGTFGDSPDDNGANSYALILGESEGQSFSLLGCVRLPKLASNPEGIAWSVNNIISNAHVSEPSMLLSHGFLTVDGAGLWITREDFSRLEFARSGSSADKPIPFASFTLAGATVDISVNTADRRSRGGTFDDHDVTVAIRCDRPLPFEHLKREVILPLCSFVNFATASRGSVKLALFGNPDDPRQFYSVSGSWTGQSTYRPMWMIMPLITAMQVVRKLDRPLEKWAAIATTHRHALEMFLRTPQEFSPANGLMDYMSLISCLDSLLDIPSSKRIDDDLMNELGRV